MMSIYLYGYTVPLKQLGNDLVWNTSDVLKLFLRLEILEKKKKKINEENVTIESQQCDPVIDSEMQIEVCVQSV